jgi:ketosteroid isomerase-like protein
MSIIDPDAGRAARRARNEATVSTMLAAFSAGDPEGQLVHCADDIVYEAPYYDNMVKRGKDEMRAMMGAVSQRFDAVSYVPIAFIPALDPDLVLCEVQGDHPVTGSDRRYQNHYFMLMQFRDGVVVHWREISNPLEFRRAVLGE